MREEGTRNVSDRMNIICQPLVSLLIADCCSQLHLFLSVHVGTLNSLSRGRLSPSQTKDGYINEFLVTEKKKRSNKDRWPINREQEQDKGMMDTFVAVDVP